MVNDAKLSKFDLIITKKITRFARNTLDSIKYMRELFELYATNEYSMKQIENLFLEKGYRNHNGNKLSHSTMSNTIANPKYKGYYVGNKVKIVDMFTKKQ